MILLMVLTGVIAGILSAILGIGGGIIMLPAIQLVLKFDPATAVATTLLAVALTAFSGALGHYRNGVVNLRNAMFIGLGGVIGIINGSYIFAAYLTKDTDLIQLLLGILFLIMAFRMLKDLYQELTEAEVKAKEPKSSSPIWLIVLGIIVGILAGMLGVGGGFLMVPAMMWLFGAEPLEAVGTTLLAMLPITLIGAFIKIGQGFVNLNAGLIIGIGSIFGAQLGVWVSTHIKAYIFKILFVIIFFYFAISYLWALVP